MIYKSIYKRIGDTILSLDLEPTTEEELKRELLK